MTARRLLAGITALAVTALVLVGAPASANAAPKGTRGHCIGSSGPMCHFWMAKVDEVADGDTIMVYLRGDASHHRYTVRFTGINAMEMHRYSSKPSRWTGECYSIPATRYVRDMIKRAHWQVRLAAQDPASHSGARIRRQVSVHVGGHWVDLNAAEIVSGQALWLGNDTEWAWNKPYGERAAVAASHRVGLYSTRTCGSGPSAAAALQLYLRWDADGNDGANVNGEWIRIRNLSAAAVPVGGWWLRDSSYVGHWAHGYTLPTGATVPPNGEITVHVGRGRNSSSTYYWGMARPLFANSPTAPHWNGDGAYLFDPRGNLRFWTTYPCFVSCRDALAGRLALTADHTSTPAVATITNTSATTADLEHVMLRSGPHEYSFPHGTQVQPGESLVVRLSGTSSDDTTTVKHWGGSSFAPTGFWSGSIGLRNYQGGLVACDHWSSSYC